MPIKFMRADFLPSKQRKRVINVARKLISNKIFTKYKIYSSLLHV